MLNSSLSEGSVLAATGGVLSTLTSASVVEAGARGLLGVFAVTLGFCAFSTLVMLALRSAGGNEDPPAKLGSAWDQAINEVAKVIIKDTIFTIKDSEYSQITKGQFDEKHWELHNSNMKTTNTFVCSIISICCFLFTPLALGQKSKFVSLTDEDLTIKSVVMGPVADNVSDIYAKPLRSALSQVILNDKQWLIALDMSDKNITPESFIENTNSTIELLKKNKAEALITARISKGPGGINLKLQLLTLPDGRLLIQESAENIDRFETSDIKDQFIILYRKLMRKMPYAGIIMSRKGNLVTMNFGSLHGAKEGEEINSIQILKVLRHPKLNFITSVDQEIMGSIRLTKVEDALSFGVVTKERSEGTIRTGSKVLPKEFIVYPDATVDAAKKDVTPLNERGDSQVALGQNPKEWVPLKEPSFGRLGLMVGLGSVGYSTNLTTAGSLSASTSLAPAIKLESELWLNPYWFINFNLKQLVFNVSNPLDGSSPGTLNISTQRYDFAIGHNFLMQEDFFGPKVYFLFGSMKHSSYVDSSTPLAFTSASFGGLFFGVGGSFPQEEGSKYTLGAGLNYVLSPSLSESPSTSGDSSTRSVNQFYFNVLFALSQRMKIKTAIEFESYGANFSGAGTRVDPASSLGQRITTITSGLEYQF